MFGMLGNLNNLIGGGMLSGIFKEEQQQKLPLTTLENGMRGYFVPGEYDTKENEASQTPRQLFVQVDDNGNEAGSYYFDPKGGFTDMTKGNALNDFLGDPDTFDKNNPSNFEPAIFKVLQAFKDNPEGLRAYFQQNPNIKIYKQRTTRK